MTDRYAETSQGKANLRDDALRRMQADTPDLGLILTGIGLALVRVGDLLGDLQRLHTRRGEPDA